MHDYFDILGVPLGAPAQEIRRACARRAWKSHPDFRSPLGQALVAREQGPHVSLAELTDLAADFVDMSAIAERMQSSFFGTDL